MDIRYHFNEETGLPHICDHGVTEAEVEDILWRPGDDRPASEGSRMALGQTRGGRYLRVIYVPDAEGDGVFVVTAYPLHGKLLAAFRRHLRRRGI
jgi:hypothetical protein